MSDAPVLQRLSFEEYIELEHASPFRHEFVDGVMYLMSGATKRHNEVLLNVYRSLYSTARAKGCRAYTESVKLRVANNVYYPDVMVTCRPSDDDYIEMAPCLVVEVLSDSTRRVDLHEKRLAYSSIASLAQYVIIDTARNEVEVHQRSVGDRWSSVRLTDTDIDSVDVRCLDMLLPLAEIFAE